MARKKGKRQHKQPEHKREISDESFEQLLNESFKVRHIEVGDEIEATVIGVDKEYVFVDLGARFDGVIRKSELTINGELTVTEGDPVTVFVTGLGDGMWYCSYRRAPDHIGSFDEDPQKIAVLNALEEAFNRNLSVEGKITTVTKGGFEVQLMGLRAFCPLSQVDMQYCENPDEHLDKIYTFKIIQFEEEGKNVVVSRREYLVLEAKKKAENLWQQVEEGRVYKGTVTAVRNFGAFVDIGGIEGLLHISEISYERIKNAGDKLKVGDELDVAIKTIDRQNRKLSFSLKSLMEDPWTAALKKLKPGAQYQGKVVRLKTYGAFIELFPGVDGMVHVSKLGTDRIHRHPKEVLKIGDIVPVRVIEVDEKNKRISLTMEQEDGDFSQDLERLKKDQDKSIKSSPSHMEDLLDDAMKNDKR
ncbi:MAG: S1 RNA-binding domain-containing protein [Candidatus Aminicenantes bacterium]|nr:MAG: S1 RNA-binding domain-containing protein [Candidatus Aminicenantes bacterium]